MWMTMGCVNFGFFVSHYFEGNMLIEDVDWWEFGIETLKAYKIRIARDGGLRNSLGCSKPSMSLYDIAYIFKHYYLWYRRYSYDVNASWKLQKYIRWNINNSDAMLISNKYKIIHA